MLAHSFVGAGIDIDRLPPSGGIAAGDMGGDDMEAGGLFETECFAQFVVFRFERLEARFDELESVEFAAGLAHFLFENFGAFCIAQKFAGAGFK